MWRFFFVLLFIGCDSSSPVAPTSPPPTCWAVVDQPELTIEFVTKNGFLYAEQSITPYARCKVGVSSIDGESKMGDTLFLSFYGAIAVNGRQYNDFWARFYSETRMRFRNRLGGDIDTIYYRTGRKILDTKNFEWIMEPSTKCCGCGWL
jgi:hypothetical protein